MYVHAGRPAFARPYVGVHRSTPLMSSSLLLQQCPACLVRLTWSSSVQHVWFADNHHDQGMLIAWIPLTLAICPYQPSLLESPLDSIQCLHKADGSFYWSANNGVSNREVANECPACLILLG